MVIRYYRSQNIESVDMTNRFAAIVMTSLLSLSRSITVICVFVIQYTSSEPKYLESPLNGGHQNSGIEENQDC